MTSPLEKELKLMANQTITRSNKIICACTPPQRAMIGAMGGIIAGLVFGMMMNLLNMIGTIAMLVGSKSTAVGWAVHLAISMFIGIAFSILAEQRLKSVSVGLAYGIVYGIFWWVLGALILMPAKLNMPLFHFNTMAWQSLMGHVVFGMVLGALTVVLPRRMHNA
jgi:uncharacterized membrane protein YagU involved in acid resistance